MTRIRRWKERETCLPRIIVGNLGSPAVSPHHKNHCRYLFIFPLLTYCRPRYIFFAQDDRRKRGRAGSGSGPKPAVYLYCWLSPSSRRTLAAVKLFVYGLKKTPEARFALRVAQLQVESSIQHRLDWLDADAYIVVCSLTWCARC